MPLISPHALLYTSLAQDPPLRASSRKPTQCRPISINTSSLTHANGSTLIKIGQTTAVCGVRPEILPIHEIPSYRVNKKVFSKPSRPDEDEDTPEADAVSRNHNLLVPNLELSTGCSPFHLPGSPPSQEAQSLSQRLLSLLHTSRLVRLSDLCIYDETATDLEREISDTDDATPEKKLKAFWVLYIDTVVINHDGNVFDACALAMFSALKDTLLPKAWWDADIESVMCSPERDQARRLRLRGCPVPMSFSVFRSNKLEEGGTGRRVEQVLCDPDAFEDGCCREQGCVVVDSDKRGRAVVVKLEKNGGGSLGMTGLRELVERAGERWKEWQEVLISEVELKKSGS
jgi:exosome complex component RRP43